ncbi:hypothetical protein B566_EDAN008875 [Ephemera danica]|nr:hypothetical protein B566_EDAN008875 [Ephemera danica]
MGIERASPDRDTLASTWIPRDGGLVAWSVLVAACFCNGVTLGFVFSKSVIYTALLDHNADSEETNLASKTSLVLSLSTGMIFLMAPFAGFCVNRFGFRATAFLGAFIAASALFTSSFLLHSVPALYATFLLFGTGTSLVEVTSITVLGMHFQRHLGLVNGIVTSSSAVFGSIFPYLMKFLLLKIGLQGLLWSFAGILILSGIIAVSLYQVSGGASCLLGPIGTQLCGIANAPQAIGLMFGLGSLPLIAGPPIAVDRASPDRDILASTFTPRDGGLIAWSVLVAACICNGVTLGFIYSKSVIYSALLDYNVDSEETNLASKTSLVLSMGTGVMYLTAPFAGFCVNRFGFRTAAFLGGFISGSALLTSSFLLQSIPNEAPKLGKEGNSQIFNRDLWTNKKYIIWCLTFTLIWFGYYVPFVHIMKYAELYFPNEDEYILSMSLNLPAIVSRVIFGTISDLQCVNTVYLQLFTFLTLGIATILVPVVENWPLLITITVCIGLLGGGAACLVGPIATQLCGISNAPQAVGFMFGISSIPVIAGPPLAGLLYDQTGSYEASFFMSAASIIIGSILMSTIHCVKHKKSDTLS